MSIVDPRATRVKHERGLADAQSAAELSDIGRDDIAVKIAERTVRRLDPSAVPCKACGQSSERVVLVGTEPVCFCAGHDLEDVSRASWIRIPHILRIGDGEDVALCGHPPRGKERRRWLMQCVQDAAGDMCWLVSGLDMLHIRDAYALTWRLPGCEEGCAECDPADTRNWRDDETDQEADLCDLDWWRFADEDETMLLSDGSEYSAQPFTEFSVMNA